MSVRSNVDRAALNERVTFERKTLAQDPTTGDITEAWATVVTAWARVDGQKASERYREPYDADVTLSTSEPTVWVRADVVTRNGITVADRILWRGGYYDIKDIPDQQLRGRMMALFVRKGQSSG